VHRSFVRPARQRQPDRAVGKRRQRGERKRGGTRGAEKRSAGCERLRMSSQERRFHYCLPQARENDIRLSGLSKQELTLSEIGRIAYLRCNNFKQPMSVVGHYPALRVNRIMSGLPPNADVGSAFHGWSYHEW
jgi:hypothetical protein